MATDLTVQPILGGYLDLPLTANSLDITVAAADVAGNTFTVQRGDIILVRNSGASARNITITTVPTAVMNRPGATFGPYSLGAGEYFAYAVSQLDGFKNTGTGKVTVTCAHAECLVAILRP